MRQLNIFSFTIFVLFSLMSATHAADIENGKIVFKRCAACHNADKPDNRIGPTLQGIIGRKAGALEGYRYSPAMVNAGKDGLIWTRETLMTYLHNPQGLVKGTRMASIRLNNDSDIDDLIEYLKSVLPQSDKK
ncbi:c-type cytochrome [Bartonella apis]|uniref:c-type cytochrome n=1 Tax=Bartonella apis TaxID=1686310 RepID=UPI001FEEF30D|nr:cytochrome c family protein [Bartonella apis]